MRIVGVILVTIVLGSWLSYLRTCCCCCGGDCPPRRRPSWSRSKWRRSTVESDEGSVEWQWWCWKWPIEDCSKRWEQRNRPYFPPILLPMPLPNWQNYWTVTRTTNCYDYYYYCCGSGDDDANHWVATRLDRGPFQILEGVGHFKNMEVITRKPKKQ